MLLLCLGTDVAANPPADYAANSCLSTGKWVKIQVSETGIYKLTNADLQKMGFSDPGKVSVHGYGGWPLAEDFAQPYMDDLPATAVWRTADGLLFYARGPIQWSYNATDGAFEHTNNPYATAGYYFITDSTEPKEMETVSSVEGATLTVRQFDDYQLHEKELVSLNESGRQLFGESFDTNLSQSFAFSMPGITNEEGKVTLRFVAKATSGNGTVSLSIGDQRILNGTIRNSSKSDNYTKAIAYSGIGTWTGEKSESFRTQVQYSTTGHENVRLDYIRVQAQRTLKPYGACTFFRSIASIGNVTRFILQEATAQTKVWDVTDPVEPKLMDAQLNGSELSFVIPAGELREFAVVQSDQSFPTPTTVGSVENQDLHA